MAEYDRSEVQEQHRKTQAPPIGLPDVDHRSDDAEDARLLAEGELNEVLARHLPALLKRAQARMSHGEAQDCVQDAMIRVVRDHRRLGRFDLPIRVILHKRLTWQINDQFDARPNEAALPEDWHQEVQEPGYDELASRDYVEQLLDHLDGKQRRVAEALYLDGLSIQEIADRFDMTRNAVDQALHRVHRRLKEILDEP